MPLARCASCRRHIRLTETACPFCGSAEAPEPPPRALGRVSRAAAAAVALGAATLGAGTLTTACEGGPDPEPEPMPQPVYGAPPEDAAADAADDAPLAQPPYGAPADDGG
jgi:hypothetical protein